MVVFAADLKWAMAMAALAGIKSNILLSAGRVRQVAVGCRYFNMAKWLVHRKSGRPKWPFTQGTGGGRYYCSIHEVLYTKGTFKCYVTLFFCKLDPHPPPRNANNIEHYTFITLFSGKSDTPHPHLHYVTLEWPPNKWNKSPESVFKSNLFGQYPYVAN